MFEEKDFDIDFKIGREIFISVAKDIISTAEDIIINDIAEYKIEIYSTTVSTIIIIKSLNSLYKELFGTCIYKEIDNDLLNTYKGIIDFMNNITDLEL